MSIVQGRTGRAGKKGKAITFVTPFENRFLREIEEYIGFEIPKGCSFKRGSYRIGKRHLKQK